MTASLLTAPPDALDKAAAAASVLPVAEAAAAAATTTPGEKPAFLPDKFWDPETASVRLEQLARSYQALERRMGGMIAVPGDDAPDADRATFQQTLNRLRGVPDSPDSYQIAERHPLLAADPELNALLHAAGFSPQQAQLVYDLAADRVLPVIEDLAAEFEADRQLIRLIDHFGGEDRWAEVSRQILAWGKAALPPDVLQAMATTSEGVLALHRMMTTGEPGLRGGAPATEAPADEGRLKEMMRDPRYWRDKDPSLTRKVTEGFRRLYPES
jgi:hypothetical protein